MEILISLLIFVVIALVLLWLLGQLPIPDPTKKIVTMIIIAILLVVFLVRFVTPQLR